jgi:hypothetical protein
MFFCNTLAAVMTLRSFFLCSAFGSMVLSSCNSSSTPTQEPVAEHYVPDPGSVGFEIEPLPSEGSTQHWLATYVSKGKTAKFRIELGVSTPLNDKESKEFDIQRGDGRFIAEPESDASILLEDLKNVLEAKKLPSKPQRVKSLPFIFVGLGNNYSQAPNGGFNAKPSGNWNLMKLFIGQGEREGDVFLNLNPVIKKGQFSIKDAEYGDNLLAQLARVL